MSGAVIEPVARLIEALSLLPGVGPKTAQRLTYHLLRAPEAEARQLAAALIAVRDEVAFNAVVKQAQAALKTKAAAAKKA